MADKRAYFKLDVGYMSNPKVLAVLDESPTAILLHVASIGYAAQHLTDGVIPVRALLRMTGAEAYDADLLYAAGLWVPGPDGGKAEVHDFLQHQRSAEEVKGLSEAGRRGAKARWDANRNADGMRSAKADASEFAMPREEREERETEEPKDVPDRSATDATKALALVTDNRPEVGRLCEHLADRIESNGSAKPAIGKGWHDAARLMLDKDNRTEEEIHGAIEWCQADEFWRANVLSMPTLRTKYDQLRLQAQRRKGTSRQQETDDLFERAARRMGITEAGR